MLHLLLGTDWTKNRDTVLNRIAADVRAKTPNVVLIVPELITHDMERRLCAAAGDTASRYAEVLSLSRLALRVADTIGCAVEDCLDNGGRVVAMAAAARMLASRLKAYAAVETKPEFLTGLLDAVDEFDASLFLNESGIALASEWLLGEESYGVSLKDFAKNFENSEFGSGGEYDLEIELPEKTENVTAEVEKMAEDSKKVSVAMVAELLKQIEEKAEIEKDEAELTFNGKAAKTTAVTVSMDHKQLFAVISGMLNYVRTDEGIRTYIENYAEYVLKVAQAGYEIDEEDVEEFVEEFYEELDVLCEEELDYLEEELIDGLYYIEHVKEWLCENK